GSYNCFFIYSFQDLGIFNQKLSSVHLKGRKIIVGVTGSIAAYKAALLIRLLKKQGAHVQVIMTSEAQNFITPLTLATLSGNPVLSSYYNTENGVWHNH